MRDPRLRKLPSPLAEAEAPVEPGRVGLRVQRNAGPGALARQRNQGPEKRGPHAAPAPFDEDRHPADPALGHEPSRSDGAALGVAGDGVLAALVPFVQFELARHALFFDEYFFAHRARQRQSFGPGKYSDRERRGHGRAYI